MERSTGTQLALCVRQKIGELKSICTGIDDKTAAYAPPGRWSPKEVLSHLIGPKESAYLRLLQLFLKKDNPTIDINPGNPFFSEEREKASFADLFDKVVEEYEQIAVFSETLTDEQLARTAYVPLFKESPLGENPTLGAMIKGFGEFHVQMHIEHLQEILQNTAG